MGKPIKRNEHIVSLSREHHFSLLFGWKIKTGIRLNVEIERICDYVFHFWEENLLVHFRQEEEVLFAIHQDELVRKAIEEHRLLRSTIDRLRAAGDDETRKEVLLEIAEMVTDHVRFEERELFPHLEKLLSEDQLRQIGHGLQELQPEPLQDNYEDEFWVKRSK